MIPHILYAILITKWIFKFIKVITFFFFFLLHYASWLRFYIKLCIIKIKFKDIMTYQQQHIYKQEYYYLNEKFM